MKRDDCILRDIVKHHANKIARYILAPVTAGVVSENNMDNKDGDYSYSYSYSYNFPNIDITSSRSRLPEDMLLIYAVRNGCDEIVSLLLNHPNMTKECINNGDEDGFTPVHYACCQSSNYYIDNRLNWLNMSRYEKELFVNFDIPNSELAILKMLLNDCKTTDVNCVDDHGETALMYAAYLGNVGKVEALLSRKDIDCNIKNMNGQTALRLAKNDMYEIVKLLEEHTS